MADSPRSRSSRSRSRSASPDSRSPNRTRTNVINSPRNDSDNDIEEGQITVYKASSPSVDRRTVIAGVRERDSSSKSNPQHTSHSEPKPKPDLKRKHDTEKPLSNSPIRPPREAAPAHRVESRDSNSHTADSLRRPHRNPSPLNSPIPHSVASKNLDNPRGTRVVCPIRPVDDNRGRQPHPSSNRRKITHTIFNRIDQISTDVSCWYDRETGDEFHAFQQYRGAPAAGYRRQDNRNGPESRVYLGRFENPYPSTDEGSNDAGTTPGYNHEQLDTDRYERPQKRARVLEFPRDDALRSQTNLNANIMDDFAEFLQYSKRARSPPRQVDSSRYNDTYYASSGPITRK